MKNHILPSIPTSEDLARVTEVFKALSEPVRLQIVLLLSKGESNVTGLVSALILPQSTVSRHLTVLRAAKLVRFERHGASVAYRLADVHLNALLVEAFSHAQHERLQLADHPAEDAGEVVL